MQTLTLDGVYEFLCLRRCLLIVSMLSLSVGWLICPCLLPRWGSRLSGCRRISLSRCSRSRQMWNLKLGRKCSSACFCLSNLARVKKVPNTLLRKRDSPAVHITKSLLRDVQDYWPFLLFYLSPIWYLIYICLYINAVFYHCQYLMQSWRRIVQFCIFSCIGCHFLNIFHIRALNCCT